MSVIIHAKPGTGPATYMRCRGLRKPPKVEQVFRGRALAPAGVKQNCHSHPWEPWRVCEIRDGLYLLERW